MTTDDRNGASSAANAAGAPPLEFRIPLGTVGDPGGAAPSVLTPPPAPNAIVGGSPGTSIGATAPPVGPTLPDASDPNAMALLMTRMANEMFGANAASIVPVPSPQQMITGHGMQSNPSPGISPTLSPGGPVPDPSGPVSGVGVSPPGIGGGWPTPMDPHAGVGGSPPGSPGGLTPPIADPTGPVSGVGVSPPGRSPGHGPLPDPIGPVSGGGQRLTASGGRSTTSLTQAEHQELARGASQGGSVPSSGVPNASSMPAPSATPSTSPGGVPSPAGSPFGMPLDLSSIGGMPTMSSISVLPEPSFGETPYYIPGADALTPDSPARIEGSPRGDDPLARDLGRNGFDPYAVRKDFPILEERVHGGKRLVWLDNAATTQKPRAVIERLSYFYEHENSNVHRAAHTLAARSTDAFEKARESARRFLNAPSAKEIVWVRGATEGINLIAKTWGKRHVGKGDEIVITHLEHHANIVPWQMLCAENGATLRVAPVDDRGDVILEEYERLLGPKTRLVSIPHVSNALGTITPAKQMVEIAHRYGAHVMVDGAQAVSHMKVDVQDLGCEWYVFSGHKVFAPTGIGVVWGKADVLERSPPWQGGGNMIEDVTFEKTLYQPPPFRFEAGTGSIADAVGLGAAIEYVERIGMDVIDRYEHELLVYGTQRLATVPGLTMVGTSPNKAGVLSFVLDGQRTEDVSAALDKEGIAVRSGHHCAQPILRRYGYEATVRASLAFYNVFEDIDALVEALHRLQGVR